MTTQFRETSSDAAHGVSLRIAFIVGLLNRCRPAAVVLEVSKFVFDAVQRAALWARTHILEKVAKNPPAVTHRYPAAAVILILGVCFQVAASIHRLPSPILGSQPAATGVTVDGYARAAARAGCATIQVPKEERSRSAAITATQQPCYRIPVAANDGLRQIDNNQFPVAPANEIALPLLHDGRLPLPDGRPLHVARDEADRDVDNVEGVSGLRDLANIGKELFVGIFPRGANARFMALEALPDLVGARASGSRSMPMLSVGDAPLAPAGLSVSIGQLEVLNDSSIPAFALADALPHRFSISADFGWTFFNGGELAEFSTNEDSVFRHDDVPVNIVVFSDGIQASILSAVAPFIHCLRKESSARILS